MLYDDRKGLTILKNNSSPGNDPQEPQALALSALGWILTDQPRAERLLSLTGLTPDQLRGGLDDPQVLASVLEFLANHEPDLVLAAEALGTTPEILIDANRKLNA